MMLLFLSETWLSRNTAYNLNIDGYDCYHLYGNKSRAARRGRYGGGISVYYKHELSSKISIVEKQQLGIDGYVYIQLYFHSMKMFIYVVFIMYLVIQL